MGQKYVKYSKDFRETALRRLSLAPNVAQLCREPGISGQLLYSWRVSRIASQMPLRQSRYRPG